MKFFVHSKLSLFSWVRLMTQTTQDCSKTLRQKSFHRWTISWILDQNPNGIISFTFLTNTAVCLTNKACSWLSHQGHWSCLQVQLIYPSVEVLLQIDVDWWNLSTLISSYFHWFLSSDQWSSDWIHLYSFQFSGIDFGKSDHVLECHMLFAVWSCERLSQC